MLVCLTHTIDSDGHCMNCRAELFRFITNELLERRTPHVGDKIGLITDQAGSIAYYTGKHDSNQPCTQHASL